MEVEWQVCVSLKAVYVRMTTLIYVVESSARKWEAPEQLFSIFSLSTLILFEQICGCRERDSFCNKSGVTNDKIFEAIKCHSGC